MNARYAGDQVGKGFSFRRRRPTVGHHCDDAPIVGASPDRAGRKYSYLSLAFEGRSRFLFLVRNIEDVGSSWNARALNEKDAWPRKNDFTRAVAVWNEANHRTLAAVGSGLPVMIVVYEWLFDRRTGLGEATVTAILRHLGLPHTGELLADWNASCDQFDRKIRDKLKSILPGQDEYMAREADRRQYDEILDLAARHLDRGLAP